MITTIQELMLELRSRTRGGRIHLDPYDLLADAANQVAGLPATKHPLGFVHLDLTSLAPSAMPGEMWRLHLWGTGHAPPDSLGALHEHSWHLTSVVLVGSLRDRNYLAKREADGRFQGMRVSYGAENEFRLEGFFDLDGVADQVASSGDVYVIEPRVVHETTVLDEPTVTLVRAYESPTVTAAPGPLVLLPRGSVATGTPRREEVQPDLAVKLLLDMIPA